MARVKDENKEVLIYKAALSIILKDGFAGITMSQIASKAKVAIGTIYIYFKDKKELINKLYLHLKQKHALIYFNDYNQNEAFQEGFKTIWTNYLNSIIQFPDEAAYMEQCKHTNFLTVKTKKEADLILLPIALLLDRGIQENKIKHIDIQIIMAHLSGSANEILRLYHQGEIKERINIEVIYDLAFSSLKG